MLTEQEAKLMTSALGAGHRNYYTAAVPSDDDAVWSLLEHRELAFSAPQKAGMEHVRVYSVTDAGKAALRVHSRRDGLGNPIDPVAYYYIEEASSIVGNCVLFWAKNRSGYVCDLELAGEYSGLEFISMRDTDVAWPMSFIEQHKHTHVRVEPLDHVRAVPRFEIKRSSRRTGLVRRRT